MSKQATHFVLGSLLFGVVAALGAVVLGDILITTGGSKYEGKVTRDGSSYVVERAGGGKIVFPARMVREVIRKDAPATAPAVKKPDPRVRSAAAALSAAVEKARQQIREPIQQARKRHATGAASAADRALQRKELAAYAALQAKLVAEARALLAEADQALTAAAGQAERLDEIQAEVKKQIDALTATALDGVKKVEEEYARAAATTATADWPGWRGPNRDGKSPDTGLLKEWPEGGPKRLWQVDNIGEGFSSMAVAGGLVYTTGDTGGKLVVSAFDSDGKPKWRRPVDGAWTRDHPGSRSTPMIHDGLLYVVSGNGVIACMDAKTGAKKWARGMRELGGQVPGWGYSESVLIVGKLAVVTPGGANCIVALDRKTGKTVWASQGVRAGAQYGSCIHAKFGGTGMIVAGTHGGLVAVDARTGRRLWANPWSAGNTANCPSPAYADGYVFWANGYRKGGICMKLERSGSGVSAREAWTTRKMDCHHGGYVIHEGHIYGNNGGGWACLDLKTGRAKWQERAVGKGSLCWADGMLYLFGEGGGRAALATCSPDGLEIKGTVSVRGKGPSWAHPVVVGGRLYLRYADNLYCFDVKAK